MSKELKPCEHKIPSGLPKCCHGIAIFDWGKTPLYPNCGCGAYFHVPRPAARVPSEIEIMAAINKAGFDIGSVKGLEIARQIRALLTEGK